MSVPLVIKMRELWATCAACGADTLAQQGLPMSNGEFVANDFQGEWGGAPACRECFEAHRDGGLVGLNIRLQALMSRLPEGSQP